MPISPASLPIRLFMAPDLPWLGMDQRYFLVAQPPDASNILPTEDLPDLKSLRRSNFPQVCCSLWFLAPGGECKPVQCRFVDAASVPCKVTRPDVCRARLPKSFQLTPDWWSASQLGCRWKKPRQPVSRSRPPQRLGWESVSPNRACSVKWDGLQPNHKWSLQPAPLTKDLSYSVSPAKEMTD